MHEGNTSAQHGTSPNGSQICDPVSQAQSYWEVDTSNIIEGNRRSNHTQAIEMYAKVHKTNVEVALKSASDDMAIIVYVDDLLIDGDIDDVKDFLNKLA